MNFKYNISFSNIRLKPMVSKEKDKYLSLASINELKKFVPNIDTDKNIDLLPIAFDACVVNRVNKNGDVVDASVAKQILNNFVNKPINVEHDRSRVVGVILTASFSKFGSNEDLSLEEIEKVKEPFNITLGGVVWRIVNQDLANIIEESNDPTSENYMNISASWELGFNDYNLALLEDGEKNLENAKIISDANLIEKYSHNLRSNGGNGKLDKVNVYRQVTGDVVPLGIGLTTNPAADVKGVVTASILEEVIEDVDVKVEKEEDIQNNISQEEKINVNEEGVLKRIFMKIENINQITDELLKQVTASSVTEFIAEEIRKANETFVAEKAEKDNALKTAQEKYEALSTESVKVKEELDKVKAALSKLEEDKLAKEKEETFNVRMAALDEEYDLSEEDRQVLALDIKDFNEDSFASYMKKMSVLMKEKKKKNKLAKEEVKSSEVKNEVSASATEVVEEVIETSKLEKASIPNSSTPNEASMKEKYSKAFGLEGFDIK